MMIPEPNDELARLPISKANRAEADAATEGKLLPSAERPESQEIRSKMAAIEGDARAELSSEHIVEIQQRIRDGAYNTVEIADQLAQRLLKSGDLDLNDE